MLTEVSPSKNGTFQKRVLESEEPNQSLVGSFPSLSSGQNNERKEEDPVVPSTNRVNIL